MVHFKKSSLLLFAALFASANSRSVGTGAYSGLTIRDLLEHEVFSRRHLDTDLEDISERHYEDLYARHPDHFVNFFESVGNIVKRAAHDYWQHMIRK
ncbi:hypothetical protein FA13DRAFT_1298441 [Coprinellus micaceus]|uniref:Uncharacterized protein n=1 Tax=Coprinellus micaceus TaxID=71717 RepID=A0A4Y7SST0_COPMI|nr:hypothetical protein FA13DRAFT_1298441 [Coprinellus micaceus]